MPRAARKPAAAPAPVDLPPEPGAYRIDQLGFCQCRFICSEDRAPVRYCGRRTEISARNRHGSWCEEHYAVVFEPRRRGDTASRAKVA